MGFHTYPLERADALEDPSRYRYCSREELLGMLEPASDDVVAELGSGTGFYADDVAPFVDTLYAVDVQPEMHAYYREKGLPTAVECVTADVASLPFEDDELDAAYSTMTHHEYASAAAFAELERAIRPGGRLVTVDWTADGDGESGPPLDERFGLDEIRGQLEGAGFTLARVYERPETIAIVARWV